MKRLNVPRASIAVTILDDADYMMLCQSPEGRHAFALFAALLAAAKNQDNGGKFCAPLPALAMMVRWNPDDFKTALEKLLEIPGKWLVGSIKSFSIRNFAKWNKGWGGARHGAGKTSTTNQDAIQDESSCNQDANQDVSSCIQDANQDVSSCIQDARRECESRTNQDAIQDDSSVTLEKQLDPVTASASVSVVKSLTTPPRKKRAAEYDIGFEDFWACYPKLIRANKPDSFKAWRQLTDEQRTRAHHAVKVFKAIVESAGERQKYFKRTPSWLRSADFDTEPEAWRLTAQGGGKSYDRKVSENYVGDDSRY